MGNGLLLLSDGSKAHTTHRGGLVIYLLVHSRSACLCIVLIHKNVSELSWDAPFLL